MVTKRRGHGDGDIHKRTDGRWEARLDLGSPGGQRQRKSVYGATRTEVVDKLRRAQDAADKGLPQLDERVRVDEYLEVWLSEVVKPNRAYATWQGYSVNVTRHIIPVVGHLRLAKLGPADVQALLNAKRAEGLAPRTLQYIHATVRASLSVATRWGLVARNVATLVEPVTVDRAPVVPFTPHEVQALLSASRSDRLGPFYTVAMAVGLRPSEALALMWDDVDLTGGSLRVRHALERHDGSWVLKEPKSRRSRRTIMLPRVCIDALRDHRRRQMEERLVAGNRWEDHGLVFATPNGQAMSRTEVSRRFSVLQEDAGVSHHRLYDCRHTAASLLLAQGVAARVVMEILGHSSFSLTMDTYTSVMPVLMSDAADAMDRALAPVR
ncbi:MAG: tyrosine-type recombinase/integrase [Acidimicrobiales bacterium]